MAESSSRRRFPTRDVVVTAVKYLFALAVLAFGAIYIATQWGKVSAALSTTPPWIIVTALVLVLAALFASMLSWWVLWPAFGARLGLRVGARVFFVSQLGKYVPGSVWPIAAQAQMTRRLKVSAASSVVLSLIAMLVSVAIGLAMGAVLGPISRPRLLVDYWWLVIVGVLLLVLLAPSILTRCVHIALRVLRRPDASFRLSWGTIGASAAAQAANWILGGLQLWLLVIGVGGDPGSSLIPCLAAFPLAFSLGILLVPFPAGLGVREFVITLLLAQVIPAPAAVTAAVLSRLLYAISDFGSAGVSMIAARGLMRATGPSEVTAAKPAE